MNKKIVVGLLAGIATVTLLLVALNWPGNDVDIDDGPDQPGLTDGTDGSRIETWPQTAVPAPVPEFQFVDQSGEPFGLEELKGKVWIADFMYTGEQGTSAVQAAALAEVQQQLATTDLVDSIRIVSFTLDPDRDTPEVLARHGESYGADDERWKFLTGPRDEIWRLSLEGFGLYVGEDIGNESSPISHDPQCAVVDRSGQIRAFIDLVPGQTMSSMQQVLGMVLSEFEPENNQQFASMGEDITFTHIIQPPTLVDLEWLAELKEAQLASAETVTAFHEFQFTDQVDESGITFFPQIVDEQRRRLQVNHYDHGNGIAVADVDGDGLLDIYFVSQVGPNELWRGTGEGRFEDHTDAAAVGLADRLSVSASFADVDNDGDADLYVTTVRDGNALLLNDGTGRFQDRTEAAGLEYSGHSSAATFLDYDRDGYLDLFLCNVGRYTTDEKVAVDRDLTFHGPDREYEYFPGVTDAFGGHLKPQLTESSILYRNVNGDRFEDVTEQVGLNAVGWTGDATPIDGNDDGWPDLYVLNMQGHDAYFENQEGVAFVDRTTDVFPETPWGAMGVKVFDYDNDGRLDLYITDMHSDMSEDISPEREKLKSRMQWPESFLLSEGRGIYGNAFYRNLGGGVYQEVSDEIGAENYWPWGLSVGDLNADGYEDVFVASSMCFPYRYSVNSVLLNLQGQGFADSEFILGVEPRPDGRTIQPWFSLDASGRDSDHPFSSGRSGDLLVWSALGTRSSVLFDVDDDGDLDIVTNDFNSRPMVLLSDLNDSRGELSYVKLRLEGTDSNRDGLGAIVRLVTSDGTQTRVVDGKSGYLSQSRLPLYFGLGAAQEIERFEVDWPSGAKQVEQGPFEANRVLLIRESGGGETQ